MLNSTDMKEMQNDGSSHLHIEVHKLCLLEDVVNLSPP